MPRKHLGGIFALALIVRLVFVIQWHAMPYGTNPLLDALAYHNWAQDIADGHLSHGRAFYLMPLFPYLLGMLYAIFGHSLWVASLFNAVLGATTCAILADLAFASFGLTAAMATGLLAALYRPLIFYTPPVMKETLGIFLLTLFASLAYRALQSRKIRLFLWSGITLGLGAIVRGNMLALAFVILGFIFWMDKVTRLKNGAAFLAGIALIILPVTLHNAITSDDFVLTSYADGFNAYIGNGPMANGKSYVFPRDVTSNPAMEEFDITRIAVMDRERPLKPSEVSAYWWDKTIDYAIDHPGHDLSLLINKIEAFWSNDEPYDNYDMGFIERNFGTVLAWPLVNFGLITAMAVFAMIAATRDERMKFIYFGAMILAYMATLIPFYVTDRYRLSVVVFILPLAGAAISIGYKRCCQKKTKRLLVASVPALLIFSAACWPTPVKPSDEAFGWSTLCTVYEDEGDHVAALLALNRALEISPHTVGSDAWVKSADAMDHMGRHREAEDTLQKGLSMYPQDGTISYNLGRMQFLDGNYPAALTNFLKAIELTPTFALSYRGAAAVYDNYGDRKKALEMIRAGLAVNPTDPMLLEVLPQLQ